MDEMRVWCVKNDEVFLKFKIFFILFIVNLIDFIDRRTSNFKGIKTQGFKCSILKIVKIDPLITLKLKD